MVLISALEEGGIIMGALRLTRGFLSSRISVCVCICGRWPFTVMSAHVWDVGFSILSLSLSLSLFCV